MSNKFSVGVAVAYKGELCYVKSVVETSAGKYYDIEYKDDVIRVSEESLGLSSSDPTEVMKRVHLADSEEY